MATTGGTSEGKVEPAGALGTGLPSDQSLVERIKAGDDLAFNEFMARYRKPVLNFVYRLLGDAALAEDVAQDVFVRVYRHIGRFRFSSGKDSCAPWVYRIARNEVIDRTRRQSRRPEVSLEQADLAETIHSRVPSAAQATDAREVGARIASAVANLPEDQRVVFLLSEYSGLSDAEIAATMQSSVKSVESRLYRAKKSLRDQLRDLLD